MKITILLVLVFLTACNSILLFPSRDYRAKNKILAFYQDGSFEYRMRKEGGMFMSSLTASGSKTATIY